MESDVILRRLHELELEVQKLKAQLSARGGRRVQVVMKKSVGFVLTYWTLLSFLVAIGVAIYIKKAFNVDYFENYRSIAASRQIADFHNRVGQDLLQREEWAAAEEAFTRALAANANDPDAAYGLLKSRIFKPAAGEKFTSPRTQDTMIAFLREQRPDDPVLDMLQALRHWQQRQIEAARQAALSALRKKPNFSWAQTVLGHIEMVEGNSEAAQSWNEKAVASDPGNATALGNLGFMYLLTGDFDKAIEKLDQAVVLEESLLVPLALSDAWRLKGEYATALNYSRIAARMAADEEVRTSRMGGGEWYYNHLPESKSDRETSKTGIRASSMNRKEALCEFAFALDLALTGDTGAAEKSWKRWRELEPGRALNDYCLNKITAAFAWSPVPPSDTAKEWLTAKATELKAP
jgi:tetratricopeptide (TPR) repeat protein